MKVTIEFTLDETWDGYEDVDQLLFLEDLLRELADGVEEVELVKIEKDEREH